ncbi:MAG: adenylate/guanylate cyclase domain-containing protein, partial [Thermoleophilia bacterium]|nr:adenylate/guanylate cyclase domain-containing protein [Thermoleophilia bacterium]
MPASSITRAVASISSSGSIVSCITPTRSGSVTSYLPARSPVTCHRNLSPISRLVAARISPYTARVPSCAECGFVSEGPFRFCPECGFESAAETSREQRRTVTVVFCDLAGSTALGESVDPERLRALLAAYFERMQGIVEQHGGTVEKFIGDAVMAVFGVPVVHEDDAMRAVRAAAEM